MAATFGGSRPVRNARGSRGGRDCRGGRPTHLCRHRHKPAAVLILYAHHQLEQWRTNIGPQVVAIAHLAGLAEENVVNVLQPPFNWYAVGRILSLLRGGAAAAVHGEVLFK